MATEVDALFKPTSASVRQLLCDLVGGFAIPSYQRPYRWKPLDQRRLCEDLISALDRLRTDESAVSFVGAIITVSGVSESYHDTIPADARQIIDGQQRLSTILMIAIAAHEKLGALQIAVDKKVSLEEEAKRWLTDQVSEVRFQLVQCIGDTKAYGDDGFKILPKMSRDVSDRWSVHQNQARYASPIANLLHTYALHSGPGKFQLELPMKYVEPEGSGSSKEDAEVFARRFQQVRDLVRDIANGSDGDLAERIDLDFVLATGSKTLTALFSNVPSELAPILRTAASTSTDLAQCLRTLLFSRFMLERLALTQINAKDESYAFELFDSLNTTGEPLTAFETFVPIIAQEEGLDSYPSSPSYRDVSVTNRIIAAQDDVQSQTARLITSFLLADSGLKVPNKHNAQRRELTDRYRGAKNIDQRRAMTKQLSTSALSHHYLWQMGSLSDIAMGPQVTDLSHDVRFALGFLNKINHTIVQAPLSRFYAAWLADQSEASVSAVEKAVKAIAAFSALWRAAHGGTDGIDSVYRSLMQDGVGSYCKPLSRTRMQTHEPNELPDINDFVEGLRNLLSGAKSNRFASLEDWLALTVDRPVYDEQFELAKFLLLLAAHGAIADGSSGLTKDGNLSDNNDMLRKERYTSDDRLATVEHIAPQSPDDDSWSEKIYKSPALIHSLGNLTLLPVDDNSFISNRPWAEKQIFYRALSTDDPDESERILVDAKESGVDLSEDKIAYLKARRQHLPLLQATAAYAGEWDDSFVRTRSEHLLSRAWDVLDSWLTPF